MTEQYSKADLTAALELQRSAFLKESYPSLSVRLSHLKTLKALLLENKQIIIDAMSEDFGHRSSDDSIIGDIMSSVNGLNYTISNVKRWMKPESRHVSMLLQPASARVEYQPLGVIGIMVPWNYPIFLAFGPLTAALAAGNRSMIKMSEFTPKTTEVLIQLFDKYFPQDLIKIIGGEANVAADFSSLPFDHLFFTGSTNVGKLVMRAASENLVPVTLELGGKSPTIIADDMPIKTAVQRVIFGKVLNAGQTCVAPDYIFVPKGKKQELLDEIKAAYKKMYPTVTGNKDCTSVVNERQYERIQGLLTDAAEKGALVEPIIESNHNRQQRQMPLTIVTNVNDDMSVMQQEIFGPVLPVMEYENLEQAIAYINSKERPLALYICSFNKATQDKILKSTHAGGVCINDAALHVGVDDLPFGGIGASGMGSYHGVEGFKTFSHAKAVFDRGRLSTAHLLFPPFGRWIHNIVYKFFIK